MQKRIKWGQLGAAITLSLALMTACGTNEEEVNENNQANDNDEVTNETENNNDEIENAADEENEAANEEVTGGEFPITLTDKVDREVTIDEEPETIVSLLPSNTEIVFELGAGDRLIGVSDFCNYPPEAEDIQNVGGQDMDPELILSLEPDMALVQRYHYENHSEILDQYEQSGIDVLVIEGGESFDEAYDTIKMLGSATGTSSRADEIVVEMKDALAEIEEKAEEISEEDRKTVWVEISPSPNIFTAGQGTFMHEMLEVIQATNAAEDQEGWVSLTEEEIVMLSPDVIITTHGVAEDPIDEVVSRDGWSDIPAVQDERIHDVDNDTVIRPGPRLIEGVETLAKLVYPEIFE
ncbi:ABC transporter substrate-binding protein [Salipaludibacillus sp. HK11]|uniref:ABC transporter substrate-binding protein n=1 Tax=Salipaludibacillus sp. HK11 TaxID=3394320 RepID=UPI0039FBBADC